MTQKKSGPRKFSDDPWNFSRSGMYGIFTSAGSIPLEYLLTTFRNSELDVLQLARDVTPEDEHDFELLMQRDIDTTPKIGAVDKLKEYLIPGPSGDGTRPLRTHSIFFPPLLVACVPCSNNTILSKYPSEEWMQNDDSIIRRWENLFQLSFWKSTADINHKFEIRCSSSEERFSVDLDGVQAKFNVSLGVQKGVKLIAIDGQHRLKAMKEIAGAKTSDRYAVPVCILFATYTSKQSTHPRTEKKGVLLPNVHQTFRKVFVDVNTNMTPVGSHFSILLNDSSIGSLIIREFCSRVTQQGKEYLSAVEWNVRGQKDATKLTRKYSITSIGIIDKALSDCFGRKADATSLLPRLLDIESVSTKEKLSDAATHIGNTKIEWTGFSIAQREILIPLIRSGVVELLFKIFFETGPFRSAATSLVGTLNDWDKNSDPMTSTATHYTAEDYAEAYRVNTTHHNVLEIEKGERSRKLIAKLGDDESKKREKFSPVMGLALFQRSLILSLRQLMVALDGYTIHEIAQIFLQILEKSMDVKLRLFSFQPYTFNTIWKNDSNVRNIDRTCTQFSRLTLSICGNEPFVERIVDMNVTESVEAKFLAGHLKDLGRSAANDYWKRYKIDNVEDFKRNYPTRKGLSDSEIDKLNKARDEQREESSKEKPFDRLVESHLDDDFKKAKKSLMKKLGFNFYASEDGFSPDDIESE